MKSEVGSRKSEVRDRKLEFEARELFYEFSTLIIKIIFKRLMFKIRNTIL